MHNNITVVAVLQRTINYIIEIFDEMADNFIFQYRNII